MVSQIKKFVSTCNGEELVIFKKYGEREVPLGCLYDPGERFDAIHSILKESISQIVHKIHHEVLKHFLLSDNEIKYEFNLCREIYKPHSLNDGFEWLLNELKKINPDDFELEIWINCIKDLIDDNKIWGTKADISVWNEGYYYEPEDEEYPVWQIGIDSVQTDIETPFNKAQKNSIIKSVINNLALDYRESYER